MVREKTLFTPRPGNTLEGITKKTILEMAKDLVIETCETDLTRYDLVNADEIFITATSFEILPVSRLNHKPLKSPIPGPITERLLSELSIRVGIDLAVQAQSHLDM
jgi:branched-subunit amino acid aminotransferase/4-amino-4-deoxychorismate lyase